jgi:hypothetical protein
MISSWIAQCKGIVALYEFTLNLWTVRTNTQEIRDLATIPFSCPEPMNVMKYWNRRMAQAISTVVKFGAKTAQVVLCRYAPYGGFYGACLVGYFGSLVARLTPNVGL